MHLIIRNSATETIKQELLFVGQESGKLIAIREIIHKVLGRVWVDEQLDNINL